MEKGKGKEQENFIKNGDFADGKLEPWIAEGKGVGVFEEAGRYYVRIPATANIHQNPNLPPSQPTLEFKVRTREPLGVDQSIVFLAMLFFDLADGGIHIDPHTGYVTSSEWQTFSFKVPVSNPTSALLQITTMGATEGRALTKVKNAPTATLEFKQLSLHAR